MIRTTSCVTAVLVMLGAGTAGAASRVKDFSLPSPGKPRSITSGPDGALWFTSDFEGNRVGRITTSGTVSEFNLPSPDSQPDSIAAGPDGNLWFTERNGNRIGRITPSGALTEFALPTPGSKPRGIVRGPDGAMWFTEFGAGRIGRISTTGAITEFTAGITPGAAPLNIARGR